MEEPVAGLVGEIGAVPLGDQGVHQIERRHASGAGHAVTVDDIAGAGQEQIGKFLGEGRSMFPVDGHAIAAHDAGTRENERPARHAADAKPALRQLPQPGEGRAMGELRRIAAGADEQQIEGEIIADAGIRRDGGARGRGDDLVLVRDMDPTIERAAGEKIGGAQGLDRRGIGHEREARHQ